QGLSDGVRGEMEERCKLVRRDAVRGRRFELARKVPALAVVIGPAVIEQLLQRANPVIAPVIADHQPTSATSGPTPRPLFLLAFQVRPSSAAPHATFRESSVPPFSGSVIERKPFLGSRTKARKSGSALSFMT